MRRLYGLVESHRTQIVEQASTVRSFPNDVIVILRPDPKRPGIPELSVQRWPRGHRWPVDPKPPAVKPESWDKPQKRLPTQTWPPVLDSLPPETLDKVRTACRVPYVVPVVALETVLDTEVHWVQAIQVLTHARPS